MLMLNKELEPVGSNNISVQLNMTQVEGFPEEFDVFQRAGDGLQQLRITHEISHNTFERQSISGLDIAQTRFKRAPSWKVDMNALVLDNME
ncbi:3841_t:CDS:2 [Racocetra fulgida]|uniref:3841_t:CDS:1 n=1 Tax=Racocetra fulgida TaxID=60492 RepID=A0A9N9F360_9GLOM|nr:3841_t:CDS:2 [Racocetra fulgida]